MGGLQKAWSRGGQVLVSQNKALNRDKLQSSTKVLLTGAGHQWLTPIILATQEAKIRMIADKSQLPSK
jgi:hypothetical protein